jgi:hypothetical protein
VDDADRITLWRPGAPKTLDEMPPTLLILIVMNVRPCC